LVEALATVAIKLKFPFHLHHIHMERKIGANIMHSQYGDKHKLMLRNRFYVVCIIVFMLTLKSFFVATCSKG